MDKNGGTTDWEIVRLLEICRDIETFCAETYHLYADRYADDEELRLLWEKTYKEEQNHAQQFEFLIKMRRDDPVMKMNVDQSKANQVLNMVKEIYNHVLSHTPSSIDALRSAIKLEEKLSEFHLDSVADFRDDHLKKLFHAMMLADNKHLESIKDVYSKRIICAL
jgi:rubrerythrin